MKHLPAFKAALVAAAGITAGRLLQDYPVIIPLGAVVICLASFALYLVRKERRSIGLSVLGYASLFLAFAFYINIAMVSLSEIHPSDFQFYSGTVSQISSDTLRPSVVLTECHGFNRGWKRIRGDLVLTPQTRLSVAIGDRIVFRGKAGTLSLARNPGQFNAKNYYRLNGFAGRIFLRSPKDLISVEHDNAFSLKKSLVQPVRDFVREKTEKFVAGDVTGLARAMVLGERSGISRETNENFMNSGTVHILSVSGLHIGFLTGILVTLSSVLRVPRRLRFFIVAPLLIFYALVVGSGPSVVRAVIMAIIVLFGLLLQRKSNLMNSLGFAALVILAFAPSQLFSPGFQLSFAAVLSIAFFYERMVTSVRKSYPKVVELRWVNPLLSASSLTIAATLGTVPITVFYFERVSLVSVLANLLIVPLSGIFTSMTFTFLAFSTFSSALASVYGAAAQTVGIVILKLNSIIGSWNASIVRIDDSAMLFSALYFVWLVSVFLFGGKSVLKKLVFAVLLGGNLILYSSLFFSRSEGRLYVLDVGQGDAIYIELPSGKNLLIDAGVNFGMNDAGARIIVPFLRKRGVDHIDYFVISHLHSDHIGGAASVLRNLKVRNFIYPDQNSVSRSWKTTLAAVEAMRIPSRHALAGMILDSGAMHRVYVLHPNGKYVGANGLSYRSRLNDGSVVLKVCIGRESVLLCGDIEHKVELELVRAYGHFLASEILKSAHHGSETSSSDEFLLSVRPRYGVISVGAGNRFGHPSESVIERMNRAGILTMRTDSLGAVCFRLVSDRSHIVNWR